MKNDTHHPICPKCGYDQSGEIATWENRCPMSGTCPECGLGFDWANIMDPTRVDLPWYVEHANRKRDMVGRSIPTMIKLAIPNVYWRRMGVSTRVRIPMLLVWLVLILCVLHLIAFVPVGLGNWQETWGMMSGNGYQQFAEHGVLGYLYELHNALFAPYIRVEYSYGFEYRWGGYTYQDMLAPVFFAGLIALPTTMWLVLIWLLPVTRARSSLRSVHLVRAWMLTLVPVLVFFEFVRIISGLYGWYSGIGFVLQLIPIVTLVLLVLSLVWVQWLWIAALRLGWGVRPVWPIAVLGIIASLLTTTILIVTQLP